MTVNIQPRGRPFYLADRPLALAPRAVDAVMAVPNAMFSSEHGTTPRDPAWELSDANIAVLPILGPLLQRGDEFSHWIGIATYDDIADAAEDAFLNASVRGVLLEIDSPGGEVAGLFDLADHLASLKATTGKPLWAIAREQALSAAYAIAAVADRIYTTQTGEVGSVGVLAVHVDRSAHDEMDGRKYSLIHAGAKKADGNPHIPLSNSAADDIQADVNDLYARFVTRVANNRRMSPQAVSATEAAIYRGQHALDAGFADRIGTLDAAHADFVASLDPPLTRPPVSNPAPKTISQSHERTMTMTTKSNPAAMHATPAEPGPAEPEAGTSQMPASPAPKSGGQAVPVAAGAPVAGASANAPADPVMFTHSAHTPLNTSVNTPAADAHADEVNILRTQAAEIAQIGAEAAKLGLMIDVSAALTAGTRPDALRRAVLEQLAASTDATIIASIAPRKVDEQPKESGLVAAAKEAAAQSA